MTDVFVRTTADSGGDGTTNTDSSGDGSHAYNSLTAAEAGEQGDITSAASLDFLCHGAADAGGTLFDGASWTTDSTHFITIKPQAADEHNGIFDAAKYHKATSASYNNLIQVDPPFTVIDKMQAIATNSASRGFYITGANQTVTSCIVNGTGVGRDGIVSNSSGSGTNQVTIVNNINYDLTGNGIQKQGFDSNITLAIYSNTANNCATGMRIASGHSSSRIFNNLMTNNTTDYVINGAVASDDNVSSDATSPETAHRNKTITYTDASGGDFSTSDSDIVDLGTDLSSDSLFPVTTDIIGVSRSSTPDIGAFESGAAVDNLLADDVESASEVTTPAIGQEHVLTADDVESNSEVSSPVITQIHDLLADDVESASEVSSPVLAQVHQLLADDVESNSEVTTPSLAQVHQLFADDVESNSEVSSPVITTSGVNNLLADDVESSSEVSSPTLAQVHQLFADDVQSNSEVSSPTLAQVHDLFADSVESNSEVSNPVLSSGGTIIRKVITIDSQREGTSIDSQRKGITINSQRRDITI